MASSSSSHPENPFSAIEPDGKRRMVFESSKVFDVFINHRGPDVKQTLATQLYNSLEDFGIKAFLFSEEKELGVSFPSTIETAIGSASIHIPIFSRNYADSPWCLSELVLMVESKAKIIPLFYQVKPSDLRYIEKGVYAESFLRYEERKRYLEKLQEWKEALQVVSFIAGYEFESSDYGDCKDIVSAVVKELQKTIQLRVAKYPVGLHKLAKDFERRCLDELVHDFDSQCGTKKSNVVGIFGMGGVGKTTLSKKLFNRKRSEYSRASFLFDVREAYASGQLPSLQSKLLKDIFYQDHSFLSSEEGTSCLSDRLKRNTSSSFLIVLDDIDHVEQLDALLVMDILERPGNNLVIITTRDVGVLTRVGIDTCYQLKGLDREGAEELFCWHAFDQPFPLGGYEDLVQGFINICGGLPLSLEVLGRHVSQKPQSYWKDALKKARKALPGDVNQRLKISFDSLDYEEKQIFMDIACFFIDKSITTAMTIWKASGWSSQRALETLKEKCLIEENVSYLPSLEWEVKGESRQDEFAFRMHDRLRDLGRELASELSYPLRLWRPCDLKSMESKGFQNILAQIKARCFHSFLDRSMDCQITYFVGEPEDSSHTSVLWLQLDYLNLPQVHVKPDINPSIPSWIPLQNLQCLRISNGRFQRLWESQHQAPLQLKELQISETILEEVPDLGLLNNLKYVALDDEYMTIKSWSLLESLRMNISALYWNSSALEGNFVSTNLEAAFGSLVIQNFQENREVALNKSPMSGFENLEIGNQKSVTKTLISGNHSTNLKTLKFYHMENLIEIDLVRVKTLSSLSITGCENLKMVSGISDLTNLVELKISQCPELESDSFLSTLSHLKNLKLHRAENLIDLDLFKVKALNSLRVNCCENLKRVSGISNLSKLVELNISRCPQLESELFLSSLICLEMIRIEDCKNLKRVSGISHLTKLVELNISQCPELESELFLSSLICLERIRIEGCNNLKMVSGISDLTKLVELSIFQYPELESELFLSSLICLERIRIEGCKNLKRVSGISRLTKLVELNISQCTELESELVFSGLIFLEKISIEDCKNLKRVSGISDLFKLIELNISQCPELEGELVLSSLVCLERIRIEGCKNLKRVSGISDLTKLVELNFSQCPVLESELIPSSRFQEIGQKYRIKFISSRSEGIIQKNKIRFESLDSEEKEIFMDIACFFIGKSKNMAMKIWEGSGWEAHHALESLKEKGLVQEIEEKHLDVLEWEWDSIHLGMHDQLRDLGREMADACSAPRRIWKQEDLKSLESEGGFRNIIDRIKGRCFLSLFDTSMCAQITFFSAESDECSKTSAFLLRLKLDLHLLDYPCIPSWIPLQKLQYLVISDGYLNKLWDSRHQAPVYLKELVLHECSLAECTDSIGMLKDLEKLVLTGRNEGMLVDGAALSESLRGLTKLRSLVLRYFALAGEFNLNWESTAELGEPTISDSAADRCISNLQSIEMRRIKLVSKVSISGEYCHNLESLHLDSMENLIQVDLTLVRTLNSLDLRLCKQLKRVSGDFDLPNLVTFNIVKCGELEELPSLEHLRCLERIVMDGCEKLQEITGVEELQKLKCLHLSGGDILPSIRRLKKLPSEVTSVIGKANYQAKIILDANQFWDMIGEKANRAIDVSEIGTMSKESLEILSPSSAVIMCAVVRGSYASGTNDINIRHPWGSIQSNIGGGVWIVTIAITGKTDVADYKELLTVGYNAQIKKWWMLTINKDKGGNASEVFKKIISVFVESATMSDSVF